MPKKNSRTTTASAPAPTCTTLTAAKRPEARHPAEANRPSRNLDPAHDTIAACEELFQAHGEACSCELCCLVTNFVGALWVFHMLVEIT